MHTMHEFREARHEALLNGFEITKTFNGFRVVPVNGQEHEARYTEDLDEAIQFTQRDQHATRKSA